MPSLILLPDPINYIKTCFLWKHLCGLCQTLLHGDIDKAEFMMKNHSGERTPLFSNYDYKNQLKKEEVFMQAPGQGSRICLILLQWS